MAEELRSLRAARAALLCSVAVPALIIGTVLALPKSSAFAAPDRLMMTAGTLVASLAGIAATTLSLQNYRDRALVRRYAGATAPMKDTLNFILQERKLVRRWRLWLAGTAWSGFSLSILSWWPQLEILAPAHALFQLTAGGSLALLIFQPLYGRSHIVNTYYLKRYLRQQASHIGFLAKRSPNVVALTRRTLSKDEFEAGGFIWRLDDFYKNVLVLGQPGSGKTTCVLNKLTESLIASSCAGLKTAGVILDPKGSLFDPKQNKDLITPLCERLGRAEDLVIFSPDTWAANAGTYRSIAWNPLHTQADALDVASNIVTAMRLAGGVVSHETFFVDSARIFIRHAFALWRAAIAPEPTCLQDIQRLCTEDIEDAPTYRWLVHGLKELYGHGAVPAEIDNAIAYFENEWRKMAERQRSGVQSTVTQLVDDFSSHPIAEIISGRSTIFIAEIIDSGKILYLHMPLADRERLTRLIYILVKLEFQREILRRVNKARPSFMVADEFQSIFVTGQDQADSSFFERSRESRHANLIAAQNLSSLLKKTNNRDEVMNLMGTNAIKIFLRNPELETNKFAAGLFGEQSEIIVSMSEAAKIGGGLSRNQTNYSRSTRAMRVVSPDAFARLAIPQRGHPGRQFAASIIHLGSRDTTKALELNWPVHELKP